MFLTKVLLASVLFIGLATFVRCVAINYEDARWVTGMNLVRHAYLRIVPEVEPFFVTGHESHADGRPLGHGSPQRFVNLANSLTTTSSVVAALNSVLAGSLVGDIGALTGARVAVAAAVGTAVSLVSGVLHVRYAARFRQRHAPLPRSPGLPEG